MRTQVLPLETLVTGACVAHCSGPQLRHGLWTSGEYASFFPHLFLAVGHPQGIRRVGQLALVDTSSLFDFTESNFFIYWRQSLSLTWNLQ